MHRSTGSGRRAGRAPWWALLLLAVLPGALAGQEPVADGTEIVRVAFEGANALRPAELRASILTRPTRCEHILLTPACWFDVAEDRAFLDRVVLHADVLRLRLLYYQHGYRSARVSTALRPAGSGAEVVFRIDEGEPVRTAAVEVAGLESIDVDAGALPLRAGEPLDLLAYEASRDTLIHRLRNRGYAHAAVLANYIIPANTPRQAAVRYDVVPGPKTRIGRIEIVGLDRVSPSVVHRLLAFSAGDTYREDDLLRSQRNLFDLDVFRHAEVRPLPREASDSIIPIRVQVSEGAMYRVRVGAGVNTAEALNAEARWINRDFFGGARRLELRGRVSNVLAEPLDSMPFFDTGSGIYGQLSGALTADFTQPWFLGARNTLGARLFLERRTLPDIVVRSSRGAAVSVSRRLAPRTSVALAYRAEQTELEAEGDIFFCVNFVACGREDIRLLMEPHWLAPVSLSLVHDRANGVFAPTRGYTVRADAEYAAGWLGSEFDLLRVVGEATAYGSVGEGVVVAARLRSGWVGGGNDEIGVHPQKRFFSGGPNSVRGFAQYRLGPKLLTVNARRYLAPSAQSGGAGCTANAINDGSCDPAGLAPWKFEVRPVGGDVLLEGGLEVRFPLGHSKLRGAAFLDVGQVWSDAADLATLAWTPGAGVRYFSPVGPVRIDVGYNPTGGEWLPVVTTRVTQDPATGAVANSRWLRTLNEPILWNPRRSFFDRLQLHLSIGQAF